jgi:succinate-acetate transporter protein
MSDKLKCHTYDVSLWNFFVPFTEIYNVVCTSHDRTSMVCVSIARMLIWWFVFNSIVLVCDKYKINSDIKKYITWVFNFVVIMCMILTIITLSKVPYIRQRRNTFNDSHNTIIIEKPDMDILTTTD